MIDLEIEFDGDCTVNRLVTVFTGLPTPTRPIYFSFGERVGRRALDRIDNQDRFTDFVAKHPSGFFLQGPKVSYNIITTSGWPLSCSCFIDVAPDMAEQVFLHISKVQPLFGFACASEERVSRNRVKKQLGINSVESWVGRSTRKYLPGFYWLTLLSDAMAKQHGIPLSVVADVALEYTKLGGGLHLFRFYDHPKDWQKNSVVTELCASLPGVFNVEKIHEQLPAVKNFSELNLLLDDWP